MTITKPLKPAENVGLLNKSAVEGLRERVLSATRDIHILRHNAPKSIHVRLKMYDKIASVFLDYLDASQEITSGLSKELGQTLGDKPERGGKRWTEQEDLLLIERVASYDDSIQQLANTFSRTPIAISSRISYLVGIKRISEEIAGRIEGYLNGEEVEGVFVGKIRK